jgi:predicted metal-dependent hydrolase
MMPNGWINGLFIRRENILLQMPKSKSGRMIDRQNNFFSSMHEITYGNRIISFDLIFSERKTLEISVLPDCRVVVKAPVGKEVEQVKQRVQKRARWIVKQQDYFRQFGQAQPPKEYVSGESFRYLGKQYRLKVIAMASGKSRSGGHAGKESVKLTGGYFRVCTNHKGERLHVKRLLDKWYREHAKKKFRERVAVCFEAMRKYGIAFPAMEIRSMKNRWGSCTPSGRILLNPKLIAFPTYCIDYVILHELCHLLHPYHSKEFYRLLQAVLPEWEIIKSRLNTPIA